MTETILVVNAGSSSIKFQLFSLDARDQLQPAAQGTDRRDRRAPPADRQGSGWRSRSKRPGLRGGGERARRRSTSSWRSSARDWERCRRRSAIASCMAVRTTASPSSSTTPCSSGSTAFSPLAPLHQPNNLAPIRAVRESQPQLLQVACFDTAFHRGHPEVADRYALPEQLYAEGVRRYGFHGLSYEYIANRLPEVAPDIARGRVVVAHLGSGASMCAISAGKSVESTMGFTALDGLPMGTRPGQLDPGIVLYLMSEKGMSAKEIEHFLYNECGLKGLSGISNDVEGLAREPGPARQARARLFRLPDFALCRDAGGGDGRDRRVRLHRRHRRERAGHPRGGGRAPRLARPRLRSRGKCERKDAASRARVRASLATSFPPTRS